MFNSVTSIAGLVYRINVAIVYNSIRVYVYILIYILSFVEVKARDVAAIKNWVNILCIVSNLEVNPYGFKSLEDFQPI